MKAQQHFEACIAGSKPAERSYLMLDYHKWVSKTVDKELKDLEDEGY
jgi:hypothetical protein